MYNLCCACGRDETQTEFYSGYRCSYCKSCFKDYKRDWRKKNLEKTKLSDRKHSLKVNYGLSLEDFQNMVNNQGGECFICNKQCDLLYVDHCHVTKIVRGLLCQDCNLGLGHFKDDSNRLIAAAIYLKYEAEA